MNARETSPTEPRRYEPVSDAMILVALERAERHESPNPRSEPGVYWGALVEHLGFVRSSWTTRMLRPQVQALIDAGQIVRTCNAQRVRWSLTEAGAVAATQARLSGKVSLPDSPERRKWKRAHSVAAEQVDKIRVRLADELRDALALLAEGGDSSAWYAAGENLSRECLRLGGALFCLNEWAEPDDEHPECELGSPANRRISDAILALRPCSLKGDNEAR